MRQRQEIRTVQKTVIEGSPSRTSGSVEFDDRGNGRWVPHETARTDETVIRLLDIGWMQLVDDDTQEVHRDGFVEIYRTPFRR
jgi:hypothetical protein